MKREGATKDGALSVRNFDYHEYGNITINETNNGITVAIAYMQGRGLEVKQRAEEIVTAVNDRERLREALRKLRDSSNQHTCNGGGSNCDRCSALELADAALNHATTSTSAGGG